MRKKKIPEEVSNFYFYWQRNTEKAFNNSLLTFKYYVGLILYNKTNNDFFSTSLKDNFKLITKRKRFKEREKAFIRILF